MLVNARKTERWGGRRFLAFRHWLPAEAARVADRPAGIGLQMPARSDRDGDGVIDGTTGTKGERMRRNAHNAGFRPF